MEDLSSVLQPYKELVGAAASITTILQFFSGAFVCNDIRKAGASDEFPIIPFLGGAVFGIINLQYGVIVRDRAMIQVSFAGFALSVIYTVFYYYYTSNANKTKVWAKIGLGGAIGAAAIAYAKYEAPELLEFRFGMLCTVLLFAMVGAPMLDLGDIIRNKSVGQMPFPMILSGTVVSFLWLLYGVILNNSVVVLQNLVFFAISTFQLSLFVIYPNKTPAVAVGEKKKKK